MADTPQSGQPQRRGSRAVAPTPSHPDTDQSHATRPPPEAPHKPGVILASGMRPLPEYELVNLLGRGGFGEVWKAAGPGGFDVALKFIRLGDQAGRVEMHSLELMRNIRHPHLLPMFGAWQVADLLIIAMELGDRTLLDRLRQAEGEGLKGIPQAELLEYLREAAKGLDYLNAYRHPSAPGVVGIQHKDVKPQNLLLVGGCVKVADFGLAKLLEHTITTASGGLTPAYAAPEFLNGQATRWSDQYCLAVTYCHLRGNRLPFAGSAMQVMAGHMLHPPDLSMLPEAERPIVARAMAKEPKERWPSCREFAEALPASGARQVQPAAIPSTRLTVHPGDLAQKSADHPLLPPTGTAPGMSPFRRWRKPALVGVVSLLVLSLLAGLWWWKGTIANGPEAGIIQGQAPALSSKGEGAQAPAIKGVVEKDIPKPPSSLHLLPIEAVSLEAGKSSPLEVRVQRRNCQGPVRLEVEGLPGKVQARPVTLAADQDVAHVEMSAADDAEVENKPARVVARLGTIQAEQQVSVTVRVTPALEVLPLEAVTVQAGESKTIEVSLKRRNCSGPVELIPEGLPAGVRAEPGFIRAGAEKGKVVLTADPDAARAGQAIRLQLVATGVKAEGQFQLTVKPAPPPALHLLALTDTGIKAGQRKTIPVRIRRERCAGPVELSLEGLPKGVRAESAFIGAGRDEGQVELAAEPGAARASRAVRVLAVAAGVRDEGEFKLTVDAELAKAVTNSIGMKLVLIPAGKFLMGSPEDEKEREYYDKGSEQQHEVEISKPFYMGVYEVTQGEYEKVMGINYSMFSATGGGKDKVEGKDTSRFPVEMVGWNDAVEFCKKLSELPEEKRNGRVYRLPTEAEWEYACRAGTTTPFHFGDSLTSTQANFNSDYPYGSADGGPRLGRTTRVGSYGANAFGLSDMHGNVSEWCADWYDKDYYKDSPRKDPKGPGTGRFRVVRGGSYFVGGRFCRSAARKYYEPDAHYYYLGFRVVLVASPRTP